MLYNNILHNSDTGPKLLASVEAFPSFNSATTSDMSHSVRILSISTYLVAIP